MKKLILMGAVFMGLYTNALNVKFIAENPLCNGAATGSIELMAMGGTAPYTYNWSNGATAASISGLVAGTYTVTVQDDLGAVAISSIAIADAPAIQITPTVIDETALGANDGGVFLNVRGGTPDYSYAWSNGASSKNILNIAAGTYTVTVTDINGCVQSSTSTVGQAGSLTPMGNPQGGNSFLIMGQNDERGTVNSVYPNPASDLLHVRVAEGGKSQYSIFNAAGQEVLRNDFSGNDAGADVSNLPAGNYVVKVKSAQGTTVKNIVIAK
ncbi:MAG: T9SS type A sorting domain-containing protein [Chitinophagales bacterium]|nr:T9SS type A sorting domain-containing protein [Chitinophagales bacterium]